MINPQPVTDGRSPYSSTSSQTPYTRPPQAPVEPPKKSRNWKKIFGLTFLTLFIATGTYAYAKYASFKNDVVVQHDGQNSAILAYNADKKLDPSLFTAFGDGRFNVVLVGVGGGAHQGTYLTDSIQVISLDTINKKVSLTSVPRDLYVAIPGYNHAKINEVYQDGERTKKGGGAALVREVVGNVLGVKISNFALIDFAGVEDLVNALGGIEVQVPKAIYDPLYPDANTIGYEPFSIAAGLQKMDGHTALRYSRSRETTSDFDRSMRQQLVIGAIKQKSLSLGVLGNPVKVSNMITSLQSHIRTDMQIDQIKSFISIYKEITADGTTSHVLDTSGALGLLTSASTPAYISYPVIGYDKYDAIHQWFAKNNPDPLLAKEAPSVTVLNGGKATEKQMQEFIQELTDYGYSARLGTLTSTKTKYTTTQVFMTKTGADKPFSKNYLGMYAKAVSGNPGGTSSDFEIVYVPTTSVSAKVTKSPTSSPSPTSTP